MVARRTFLRLVGLGGGSLLVAACTAPAPSTPPATAPPAVPPPATGGVPQATSVTAAAPAGGGTLQPKTGGTLRAVRTGDIAPIDPHYHSPGNGLGIWIIYDTLTG